MNVVGPILILLSFSLNIYTMLIYFVFPYTSVLIMNYKHDHSLNMALHYCLFGIYTILMALTIWSYLAASCADPGFVPSGATGYDKDLFSTLEKKLWS